MAAPQHMADVLARLALDAVVLVIAQRAVLIASTTIAVAAATMIEGLMSILAP